MRKMGHAETNKPVELIVQEKKDLQRLRPVAHDGDEIKGISGPPHPCYVQFTYLANIN